MSDPLPSSGVLPAPVANKSRKFHSRSGDIATVAPHPPTSLNGNHPDPHPSTYQLDPVDARSTSYVSVDVFRFTSPSPSTFPHSHTNLIRISLCGITLAELPKSHLKRLFKLAVPSVIGGVLSVCMNVVNLIFVGHRSPAYLGGCALGNALMLITGYTVLLGLCSSLDTLCSQAFGAHQPRLVGLIAQRAAAAYTIVIIPIALMWWKTEEFFLIAGQDPDIAALAGEYVTYALPTIFPILYSEIIKRYLQAQGIIAPQIYVAIGANIVHAIAAYVFLYQYDLGIRGASYALIVGLMTNLFLWLVYLRFLNRRTYRRTCPRLNCSHLFSGWLPLFRLGFPGMAMLLFEWMSFELCGLGAGWMGQVQLDTMIVFSNLCTMLTMAPAGIAIATSTLVGHAIGGGKHEHARLYSRAAGWLIVCFALAEFLLLGSVHSYLARIFSDDLSVTAAFSNISICVALFVMFDCFQTVESGVLRGLGLQSFGATTNLIVYYIVGLPCGFLLAFYGGIGVPGLVIGLVSCVVIQTIVFAIRLHRIDWVEETSAAAKRIEEEKIQEEKQKQKQLHHQGDDEEEGNAFGDGYRTPSDISDDDQLDEDELDQEDRAEERQQYGFLN